MIGIPNYKAFDHHLWADIFELICLNTSDHVIGTGDIEDRVRLYIEDDNIDVSEYEDIFGILPDEKKKYLKDILERFSADIYAILENRRERYGADYPFIFNGNLFERKEQLSNNNMLYVYLLFSSHLRYFQEYQSIFTSEFESFSLECLKEYFGEKLEVYVFGKNSLQTDERFKGNKFTKFSKLADWWRQKAKFISTDFPAQDTGDEGIDLVGAIMFNDLNPGNLLITGQCKCQPNWYDYRFSSSPGTLRGLLDLSIDNVNFSFAPICFRNESGTWKQEHKASGVILIDRNRIVYLMNPRLNSFLVSNSYDIVRELVRTVEEPV
jgi:hypothetical protein